MKKGSVNAVIEQMIRRLDAIGPDEEHAADGPLAEIGAFAPADAVLARLHKEYLEANRQHKRLAGERGVCDPMTEVAADMLSSARSAVQTRLIELQDIREEETREAMARAMRARKAEQEAARALLVIEKRRRDASSDLFFWFLMMIWLMNRTFMAARRQLSAANDFAAASADAGRRARYA